MARALPAAWFGAGAVAIALASSGLPAATSPHPPPEPAAFTAINPALGNRLALIEGGYDALLLRVHLIREARRSIDIQTFIRTNDECGRLLICELVEAARHGVKVDVGPFPGTDGLLSTKEILTRLYKAVGSPLTPIL